LRLRRPIDRRGSGIKNGGGQGEFAMKNRSTPADAAKQRRKIISSVRDRPSPYDDDKYYSHLLEQYKIYLEMVDRLSARRVLVNNSFITMMGAGAIAYSAAPAHLGAYTVMFQLGVSLSCVLIAILWRQTILYYRDLSQVKFKVIHEIEELLPAQPYRMEYEYFIKTRNRSPRALARGLAQMESYLPLLGAALSLLGFIFALHLAWAGGSP
jgi:hypothetical protein